MVGKKCVCGCVLSMSLSLSLTEDYYGVHISIGGGRSLDWLWYTTSQCSNNISSDKMNHNAFLLALTS